MSFLVVKELRLEEALANPSPSRLVFRSTCPETIPRQRMNSEPFLIRALYSKNKPLRQIVAKGL
jgi:hypothetical protein